MDIEELRAQAKLLKIDKWHLKNEETLRAEIAAFTATPQNEEIKQQQQEIAPVICYDHHNHRFWLPEDVAKERLAKGFITRYEAA